KVRHALGGWGGPRHRPPRQRKGTPPGALAGGGAGVDRPRGWRRTDPCNFAGRRDKGFWGGLYSQKETTRRPEVVRAFAANPWDLRGRRGLHVRIEFVTRPERQGQTVGAADGVRAEVDQVAALEAAERPAVPRRVVVEPVQLQERIKHVQPADVPI